MLRLFASPVRTAAPTMATRSAALRPLSGKARISWFRTTSLTPELCTSTSGVAPSTVTVSSSEPTDRTALITGEAATWRTMPVWT